MSGLFYAAHARHYVGVDCVIFGLCEEKLHLLLIKRRMEPCKGEWSLMGGFVEDGESVDEAAKRVLHQLTGLEGVYMKQVGAFGEVDRDPGARVISVAYCALLNYAEQDPGILVENNAHWMPLTQLPELAFDHRRMVERALNHLQTRIYTEPLVFKVMPSEFTLPQLQHAFETIIGEPIDKRNFRRTILEKYSLEETGGIDRRGSKRGAKLYRINCE